MCFIVRFSNVLQVLVGQQTENFKKPKHKNLLAQYEAQSFSLVCKDRTVDLICEDPMQTFTWIKGKVFVVCSECKMSKAKYFFSAHAIVHIHCIRAKNILQ